MLDRFTCAARLLAAVALFACTAAHAYDGPVRTQVFEMPAYANSYLYMVRANQLFSVTDRLNSIRAKFLFVPAQTDVISPPRMSHAAAAALRAQGKAAEVFEIEGEGGHDDRIFQITKASKAISDFLAR